MAWHRRDGRGASAYWRMRAYPRNRIRRVKHVQLGQVMLGERDPEARPTFNFGLVMWHTDQTHFMLGYLGSREGVRASQSWRSRVDYEANFHAALRRDLVCDSPCSTMPAWLLSRWTTYLCMLDRSRA